jgi:tRNA(Ile)-lysidine synthase
MLEATLERFFTAEAPLEPGDLLLVAFSGGPDSTALLDAAARLGARRGFEVVAAHLDHALDADSPRRARAARALAQRIGVRFELERADPSALAAAERGPEDWARRQRYAFLERRRLATGARWVATAHHRDDQIETVLLRLLRGSGLEGLGAIAPRRGHLVRPLLGVGRAALAAALSAAGLQAVDDPTNLDPRRARNLVRLRLLPLLARRHGDHGDLVVRVAAAARDLAGRLEPLLDERLGLATTVDPISGAPAASIDLERFAELAPALHPFALALLHRAVGSPYPAGEPARRELERQLAAGPVDADCGGGWCWTTRRDGHGRARLHLRRRIEASIPPFTYTLRVPGEVAIPESDVRISIAREPVEAWVFQGHPSRAALDLPVAEGDHLTVRNRQPGDRLRPLGCGYQRRLKEILIDAGVPREHRDRLPLLCVGDRIAWIPGLTIDDRYRIKDQKHAWTARIEPLERPSGECRPAVVCCPG